MNHEQHDDEVDKRIIEWADKADTYSIIKNHEKWGKIPDNWNWLHEKVDHLDYDQNVLILGFDGEVGDTTAIMLSHDDRVILLFQIQPYDEDLYICYEYEGIMSRDNFWKYLESFPNYTKWLND